MASTDVFALRRSDLNGFLFAEVGEEASGMTLSVVSALARLGMDPWDEAGRLATLPRTAAADALARIIAAMPAGRWPLADATAIATRLVALLPPHAATSTEPTPATSWMNWRWAATLALLGISLLGLVLNLADQ